MHALHPMHMRIQYTTWLYAFPNWNCQIHAMNVNCKVSCVYQHSMVSWKAYHACMHALYLSYKPHALFTECNLHTMMHERSWVVIHYVCVCICRLFCPSSLLIPLPPCLHICIIYIVIPSFLVTIQIAKTMEHSDTHPLPSSTLPLELLWVLPGDWWHLISPWFLRFEWWLPLNNKTTPKVHVWHKKLTKLFCQVLANC